MKTNFLKHLTALVFLFCVAVSAQAVVNGQLSADRREVSFYGSGVLTRALAQTFDFRQATTIRINGAVEEIEGNAFDNYTRLQDIIFEEDKNAHSPLLYGSDPFLNTGSSDIAVYLSREFEWKNYDPNKSLEEQGYKGLFQDCPGIIGVYVNPGVFRLPERSFYNAPDFKYITINTNGCRIIGEEAFRNCPLHTTIKLPEGLMKIEKNAFNGCM